jgi:hypothetical protein
MENDVLKDFSAYVEYFCKIHKKIGHSAEKKHFIRLDHQDLAQSIHSELCFPVVTLEKLTASYSDVVDSPQKLRHIEMLFLDHVTDAGNMIQIDDVESRMEMLAETFIFKTKKMRRKPEFSFLHNLRITNVELNYVRNVATLLWGVLLSFDLETPFLECIHLDDFIE